MTGMSFREIPAAARADAEILAAIQQLVPVPSGDIVRLLPRQAAMDRMEELRQVGDEEGARVLLKALGFDGETVFRNSYSQMASRSLRLETSTVFLLLREMAGTRESRNDILRRLLAPVAEVGLGELSERIDAERARLLRYSLENWAGTRKAGPEEVDPDDLSGGEGMVGQPISRTRLDHERLTPELKKYSRYFLKNLFRLNNIHGHNQFFHPPEAVENYWEVIAYDQGVFHVEMAPASRSLAVGLYRTSKSFGLDRSEDPDYYSLVEMLASEKREPRIKGCRVELHGANQDDEVALQEALSIETVMVEDPTLPPRAIGIPHKLSEEGRKLFLSRLRQMSGVRAELRFPLNTRDPQCGDQDFSVLGFDLELDEVTGRFSLDGAEVSEANVDQIVLAVGEKLHALARQVYRDPARFPQPDVDVLDAEVHQLIADAEKEGLTDDMAREIVAKITVLDYYESLAKYSYALGEQIRRYLEGTQVVTFTAPRPLLAILNRVLEEKGADEVVLSGLGGPR
ncbi:MAG: hypothetical protein ACM3L5_00935 [Candidatus Saccharibacteria bacterium]